MKVSGEQGGPKTALVELAKDDDSGYPLGFTLVEVELPPDAKGRPRKTYVVEEREAPVEVEAQKSGPSLSPQDRTGLGFLHDLLVREGQPLPPAWGMASDLLCVPLERWREECAARSLSDSKDPKNQRDVFTRTFKSLRDKHHAVAARDERVWAVRRATDRDKAATGLRQGATACDGAAG